MHIDITAMGENVRYLEPNADALGIDDPERVTPDPVELWTQLIGRGFADRSELAYERPGIAVVSRQFDSQREEQYWCLEAARLDPGLLRILGNLLRSAGIDDFEIRVLKQQDAIAAYSPGETEGLSYPHIAPPAAVSWEYTPPDEDGMVRNRTLHVELSEPFDPALMTHLREDLDLWIEVTCRSGFCPPGEEPAKSGALPTFAYALDPQTMAVDFEELFVVDEACFESIASYLHRLLAQGVGVRSASIT